MSPLDDQPQASAPAAGGTEAEAGPPPAATATVPSEPAPAAADPAGNGPIAAAPEPVPTPPPDPDPASMPDDTSFDSDIRSLRTALQALIQRPQSEDNQGELARIANLLPNANVLQTADRFQNLLLAVRAISVNQPNLVFAASVRSDCELAILRSQKSMFRFVYLLAGSTPISATLSGLVFSALGMLGVALCIAWTLSFLKDAHGILDAMPTRWPLLFTMAVVAAMGSFVSVLSRLSQVTSNRGYDAFLVFATGFFKPWIGVTFGAFLFFVLDSGLINVAALSSGDAGTAHASGGESLYCVLAFIGGFSERLVSDFITRTGNTVLAPASVPNPTAKAGDMP